jgi:hypothetical protein
MILRLVLIVALALGMGLVVAAAEPSASPCNAHATQISQLIALLGSKQFKERETAMQSLDALSLVVTEEIQKARQGSDSTFRSEAEKTADDFVEGLRQASQNHDPEVRRRAEILAQQAQKRLDAVKLLEPTSVRIRCQDMPLSEALAQFARDRWGKPTGITIQLAPPSGRTSNPHITLDTGQTTFWEAFDQFCRRAGLIEAPLVANNEQVVRVWNGNAAARVQAVLIANPYQAQSGSNNGRINLIEGKLPVVPTCYAGPVRFRAMPADTSAMVRRKDEILFVLEVTPQPRVPWQGVVDLHIDKALDDQGQSLPPALGTEGAVVAGANGGMVWESELSSVFDPRQIPVRLRYADRPSKVLKEFAGSIAAQIEMPTQPLITVDRILASAGKTMRSIGGESLKVVEVKQEDNGSVKLGLQIEVPAQELLGKLNGRVIIRGNGALGRRGFFAPGAIGGEPISIDSFELLDRKGQSFQRGDGSCERILLGNGLSQKIELLYHAREGQGEPAKLVYSGRRITVIDVPFVLKDVPLP